jgi:HicB-like protein involved in pilus formation
MDLTPYLESLRSDLSAAAAPGGPETTRAAELLGHALEASARLALLQALSDAAAEITTRLQGAVVDVRLRGREADLVVTQPESEPPPATPLIDGGDLARVTLRLPESLKAYVEQAAAAEGVSVNAWLVRAVSTAAARPSAPPTGRDLPGKRFTGFAQA